MRFISRCQNDVEVNVLFSRPAGDMEDVRNTALWDEARHHPRRSRGDGLGWRRGAAISREDIRNVRPLRHGWRPDVSRGHNDLADMKATTTGRPRSSRC